MGNQIHSMLLAFLAGQPDAGANLIRVFLPLLEYRALLLWESEPGRLAGRLPGEIVRACMGTMEQTLGCHQAYLTRVSITEQGEQLATSVWRVVLDVLFDTLHQLPLWTERIRVMYQPRMLDYASNTLALLGHSEGRICEIVRGAWRQPSVDFRTDRELFEVRLFSRLRDDCWSALFNRIGPLAALCLHTRRTNGVVDDACGEVALKLYQRLPATDRDIPSPARANPRLYWRGVLFTLAHDGFVALQRKKLGLCPVSEDAAKIDRQGPPAEPGDAPAEDEVSGIRRLICGWMDNLIFRHRVVFTEGVLRARDNHSIAQYLEAQNLKATVSSVTTLKSRVKKSFHRWVQEHLQEATDEELLQALWQLTERDLQAAPCQLIRSSR